MVLSVLHFPWAPSDSHVREARDHLWTGGIWLGTKGKGRLHYPPELWGHLVKPGLSILKDLFLFYVCGPSAGKCLCTLCVQFPWRPEEGLRFPWNWSYRWCLATIWVLETECGSFAKVASTQSSLRYLTSLNKSYLDGYLRNKHLPKQNDILKPVTRKNIK